MTKEQHKKIIAKSNAGDINMETKNVYSILYPDFEGVEYKQLSETTCHDLALDLLCKNLTDNYKESRLIMETISNMTKDPRVAKFRQEVFCDILKAGYPCFCSYIFFFLLFSRFFSRCYVTAAMDVRLFLSHSIGA